MCSVSPDWAFLGVDDVRSWLRSATVYCSSSFQVNDPDFCSVDNVGKVLYSMSAIIGLALFHAKLFLVFS